VTGLAWLAVGVAAVFALGDWTADLRHDKRLEYICKPAVMVALIVAALALDPVSDSQRAWFLAALVLSLAGDVFLMLPQERSDWLFVGGLGSFLLGHLAYIGGFAARGFDWSGHWWGLLLVPFVIALVGVPIVRGARAADPTLTVPVFAYIAVILAMLVCAIASGVALAAAGAAIFVVSDATLGWNRFVKPLGRGEIVVITTYHVAQTLLVLSLTV
jgi:uncharacterized membrane protein YhhN